MRVAYRQLRERAALVAGEIARDLPQFTTHDVSHVDDLWQMADVIGGPCLSLNPLEALVLGGAFVIHDLGLALAAYPEGKDALFSDPLWADIVSGLLRKRLGRPPTSDEMASCDDSIRFEATATTLRARHAARAEQLLTARWRVGEQSADIFLIDDPELRRMYGGLIGKIAHSHWWDLSQVRRELSISLGPAVGFPNGWGVRALKIACLLRAADISHIDARRAPSVLFAVRTPKGVAKHHWTFQNKVHQAQLRLDRLEFTAGDSFGIEEAPAWWLCFDTLRQINRELQQVDSLLADVNEERFAARGVVGIDEPDRLRSYIPTAGWIPVDTSVQISDVAGLVKRIGGERLYGRYSKAPLRELIQNASDAIRARRLVEGLPPDYGTVKVKLSTGDGAHHLEVSDNGVGMSERVLVGALLDFGAPYWESELVSDELPGVLSKGFRPTGRFGIGFFSVFMWADVVTVITRRYDEGHRDTRVLEFRAGLSERPIMRRASSTEYRREGGTTVRLKLRNSPESNESLLSTYIPRTYWKLTHLVSWLCPAAEVNIVAEYEEKERVAVRANDWLTIPGHELLKRLDVPPYFRPSANLMREAGKQLQVIADSSGVPIGRAAILSRKEYGYSFEGVVTVDGFQHCSLRGVHGLLAGSATVASRNSAIPLATAEQMARWATDQASLLGQLDDDDAAHAARTIISAGGMAKQLPVARTCAGWLRYEQLVTFVRDLNEVLLVEIDWSSLEPFLAHLELKPNVIAAFERETFVDLEVDRVWLSRPDHPWGWWSHAMFSPIGEVVFAISESWGLTLDDVLDAIEFRSENDEFVEMEIGNASGKPFTYRVGVLTRPQKWGWI